jgi:hypothetical protein
LTDLSEAAAAALATKRGDLHLNAEAEAAVGRARAQNREGQ